MMIFNNPNPSPGTMTTQRLSFIDSHTAGEPTRVVVAGGPDLGSGSLAQQKETFRLRFDAFRSAIVNEPRGSDVLVGAILVPPADPSCVAGVIFFNNVGTLNMCGHGTIGVAVTLAHLERIGPGKHRLDTPVGVVGFELHDGHRVTLENVPSYRFRKDVAVRLSATATVVGDIAWGGNWFFLVGAHGQELSLSRVEALTEYTWRIRQALQEQNITGKDGGEIDHIELFAPSPSTDRDCRNFVLCPGKAYDRSPCGTGTSAKLACLAADGKLAPGQVWRQESIIGSVFEGRVLRFENEGIIPAIMGSAHVIAEGTLILDSDDPFCWGIR